MATSQFGLLSRLGRELSVLIGANGPARPGQRCTTETFARRALGVDDHDHLFSSAWSKSGATVYAVWFALSSRDLSTNESLLMTADALQGYPYDHSKAAPIPQTAAPTA